MTVEALQNIVVIGASGAGHSLVNELAGKLPETHRILLIERNEFVVHMPTIVRAAVVPGWEDKNLLARITQDTIFPAGSRHRVLTNTVTALSPSSRTLTLAHPFEGSTELSYDRVVVATGAAQALPMRPAPGSSLDEYKAVLRRMQADIKAATSVLIVGGGTVGVEVAGEITAAYPGKKVTIVHGEPALLHAGERRKEQPDPKEYVAPPTAPRLSASLEDQLKKRGVELVYEDRVDAGADGKELHTGPLGQLTRLPLASGGSVEADYVFLSIGNAPNSSLVADVDPSAVTRSGHIAVDAHFHILSSKLENAYALGDVASVPGWKTLVNAIAEGPALAKIIDAEIRGKTPAAYSVPASSYSSLVTLGPGGGAGVIALPFIGEVGAPGFVSSMKNADFFASRAFYSRFRGAESVPTTL
ncbi:FAD/NAD(P)-binding domain-containing protein [Cutaneotrichosporon oleaginosum]|uniref:FAD/NAD(P)-binding domain-containing protein n=1 Tax=Cutaneotrichosporon oleaginosum TaxID=879819 RepID=A0A0J0XGC5_9TREE|nr:FAD/NAD(P)-binding domain-containing protein [Cutaneotrichosporon oleaginosum]KLT40111.1 FAD/NAD(P)-binding domain-containing protein [Cutaneotrichosporon oleaginosum]TXT04750.1 hypothetical protein COLE_07569 [Cutaneotrichosporon oleaginosum]